MTREISIDAFGLKWTVVNRDDRTLTITGSHPAITDKDMVKKVFDMTLWPPIPSTDFLRPDMQDRIGMCIRDTAKTIGIKVSG